MALNISRGHTQESTKRPKLVGKHSSSDEYRHGFVRPTALLLHAAPLLLLHLVSHRRGEAGLPTTEVGNSRLGVLAEPVDDDI